MQPGTDRYGVPDIVYDLIQTIGNLLQGEEKLKEYAADAERVGDSEAATAFRTIADANRAGAQVLLKRLRAHLNEE
ncbi:MAG: hypothetical protein KC442_03950 [Thermomicrobiales bacterium]|nr:hypothetical protein [Thermomicrobiales bacterium]